ncbi:MAG: lipid II flippase MurJ [Gammaproteobacteria bacterium]|nr:lipid II flippase MurJ [Gammaproteobacteria bacterium]
MTDASGQPQSVGLSVAVVKLFAGNFVVTLSNLLRDISVAASLGASFGADYFFLAISIPVFVISVAAGSYRSVVVPFLVRKLGAADGSFHSAATRLTWLNVTGVLGVAGLAAAVFTLGYFAVAGFVTDGGSSGLWLLMLLVIPMYALSGFVELSQGSLQAAGSLLTPNLSRAALPAGILIGAVLSGSGAGVSGLILGGTVGALIGALLMGWQLARHRMPVRTATTRFSVPEARQFMENFRVLLVATSITLLTPLIGQWLAGLLGPGSVSALGYAGRLTIGATALITGALTPVLLGFFAREGSGPGAASIGRNFFEIATAFAWAGCCMTLGFWIASEYLIELVYQRGEFTAEDTRQVALLANCYAMQFPLLFAGTAATSLISAQALNRVFLPIGLVLLVSNLILTVSLMNLLGTAGIALASSLTYVISVSLLTLTLIRRNVVSPDRGLLKRLLAPFALLGGASLLVFLQGLRLMSDTEPAQLAGAALLLAAFMAMAFILNRGFLARALASWRGS